MGSSTPRSRKEGHIKRIIATILVTLLVAPPAFASEKPGKPIDWQKVQTLKAGAKIFLTVSGGQATQVQLTRRPPRIAEEG